jgi:integrase
LRGSIFRRCACRDPETGKQLSKSCPKLTQRRHGTWGVRQELPGGPDDTRRTFRRSGYASATEAQADLDKVRALLAIPDEDDEHGQQRIGDLLAQISASREPIPDLQETRRRFHASPTLNNKLTVGEWLDTWIKGRKIRSTTISRYSRDIRLHLKPGIGHIRLERLRVSHLAEMFNAIAEANIEIEEANDQRRAALAELKSIKGRANRRTAKATIKNMPPFRRTTGPNTRRHIRAVLRAALNAAITQELITFNPAAHVELDPVKRPKALVWTEERIRKFHETGERPSPVMVWTPDQTGEFLDSIDTDPCYPLFHLIALRGLRRGEACGLRWEDIDFKGSALTVAVQLINDNGDVIENIPKSEAGNRVVALDAETSSVLKAHRNNQNKQRLSAGPAWVNTGRVFTRVDGTWLHPNWVSDRFDRLVLDSGLPPIRLHDLRHGAATIALAAGVEMKVVQETLGHSSLTLTSDTYTSVLPQVALAAAEATARLIPRQRAARTAGLTSGSQAV